jgi:hypothetical protein
MRLHCARCALKAPDTDAVLEGRTARLVSQLIQQTGRADSLGSDACLRAERPGLLCMACRTLSTFSGCRALLRGPGGFFVILPVDLNDVTHRRMVLGVGTSP